MKKQQTRVGETGHKLGVTYFCSYWREAYTVTALHEDGDVSVHWHGGNGQPERDGRHHTNVGRDKVLGEGFNPFAPANAYLTPR